MSTWAVLVRPSANRVYADATPALLLAEAQVLAATALAGVLDDVRLETMGGLPYLVLRTRDVELDERTRAHLGLLSGGYALFELEDAGFGPALLPTEPADVRTLDEDLLTIQKYVGKTNELFTRLLLNLTVWASATPDGLLPAALSGRRRSTRVLDPMCGRGTTLHAALVHGCDADGLDVDGKAFDAQAAYLKTWLRTKRLKHTADVSPLKRDGERLGRRLAVELAADKDAWKEGRTQHLTVVEADTRRAADVFRAGSADVLVTDAPYGVQHGSHGRDGGRSRGPAELLAESLPGWRRLLRPGGAVGIAWNTHVAPREQALELLAAAGLEPLDDGPWQGFRHRVDAGIDRDVVVAVNPG
ncbi:SAM-dependent methyltransferase [Nocardioides sp. GY 10127]|uniref:TRM11 family SAM-dependent methyltransferase n=1 Tax=Nocardioides sp. GY 10127 TaxID=2569762 RepID=UPI0010A7B251|nr:SAM-dependent methyltransferase [Nocardioides sp. GY 10127]TIC79956.1 SAM-dependent methyltransferase [Nocardioides sp. GY 10127]